MKKALIAGLCALGLASEAGALGGLADVTVYDRTEQRTLPLYQHQGRYYVAGKPGNEYQIQVRGNHGNPLLGVVSVDGVNVVSGEHANWGQTGYVFGARSSISIQGWRKSMQRTAAFYFTEIDNSYAARTGRPENVGVIGVALFRGKSPPPVSINRDSHERRQLPAPAAAVPRLEQQRTFEAAADAAPTGQPADGPLGTGHGRSEHAPARYASFERASQAPDEVITIYYDSYRNLVAQGIIRTSVVTRPHPFPGQFVPDPR